MQNRMKALVGAIAVVSAATVGCATNPAPSPVYTPVFDFTPPAQAAPGSAGVILGLVMPHYSESGVWQSKSVFTEFSQKMGGDFQELLAARGFTTKGPYPSVEVMTYPDKQSTDLTLSLELSPILRNTSFTWRSTLLPPAHKFSGSDALSGSVNLYAMEPLSRERMWVKSIPLPPRTVTYSGTGAYREKFGPDIRFGDDAYLSAIGKALEEYYPIVLKTAWDYLDPAEMRTMKKLADDVKKKWVAGRPR